MAETRHTGCKEVDRQLDDLITTFKAYQKDGLQVVEIFDLVSHVVRIVGCASNSMMAKEPAQFGKFVKSVEKIVKVYWSDYDLKGVNNWVEKYVDRAVENAVEPVLKSASEYLKKSLGA
tara:strand:- start:7816 stop:8172 length:357 start_codon:yes stop_codon:yes gene_type:complete